MFSPCLQQTVDIISIPGNKKKKKKGSLEVGLSPHCKGQQPILPRREEKHGYLPYPTLLCSPGRRCSPGLSLAVLHVQSRAYGSCFGLDDARTLDCWSVGMQKLQQPVYLDQGSICFYCSLDIHEQIKRISSPFVTCCSGCNMLQIYWPMHPNFAGKREDLPTRCHNLKKTRLCRAPPTSVIHSVL